MPDVQAGETFGVEHFLLLQIDNGYAAIAGDSDRQAGTIGRDRGVARPLADFHLAGDLACCQINHRDFTPGG